MNENIKNLFLITIPLLLVSFFILEIFVRFQYEKIDLLGITGQRPTNALMSSWAKEDAFSTYSAKSGIFSEGKTVNKHGFISTPEIEFGKPDSVVRIVFLGGSSTAGVAPSIKDHETWPWKTIKNPKLDGLKFISFQHL